MDVPQVLTWAGLLWTGHGEQAEVLLDHFEHMEGFSFPFLAGFNWPPTAHIRCLHGLKIHTCNLCLSQEVRLLCHPWDEAWSFLSWCVWRRNSGSCSTAQFSYSKWLVSLSAQEKNICLFALLRSWSLHFSALFRVSTLASSSGPMGTIQLLLPDQEQDRERRCLNSLYVK